MIDAAMYEVLVKIGLTVLGALAGASINMHLNRRRLRQLIPLAFSELEAAAKLCAGTFAVPEAISARAPLEVAYKFATEVIAGELDGRLWREGAVIIGQTQLAVAAVVAGGQAIAPHTTHCLRQQAAQLQSWIKQARPTG